MSGGWAGVEVAIPIPNPAPLVHVATMVEFEAPKRVGARVFWAEWFPSCRLLVLRAVIPQRTSLDRDAASLAAGLAAREFWNDRNLAIGIARLTTPDKLAAWTWPEGAS